MKESLRVASLERFKKNISSYLAVGVMCGLFLILAATLSLIDIGLFVLMIPIIVLPILFASHIACYYLEADQPITVSAIFRYFFGFYRPQFRSSFKGIKAFLISLAIWFGSMTICYIVFYAIFKQSYGATFTDSFTNLVRSYMSEDFTYEDMTSALLENDSMLLTFFLYVTSLPLLPSIIWFIYSISFASISVYYRSNIISGSGSLMNLATNNALLKIKKAYRKDWFSLNWPILVLPFVGALVGAFLSIFVFRNVTLLAGLLSIGSVVLLIFFLPFYFANMEVIYHRYETAFKEGNKKAIEMILYRIQSSIELSEEERKELEESFKNDNDEQ